MRRLAIIALLIALGACGEPGDPKLGFSIRLVDDRPPPADGSPPTPDDQKVEGPAVGVLWLRPGLVVSGDMLADAHADTDAQGQAIIGFRLTEAGAQRLDAVTRANTGQRMAILVGDQPISAPQIQTEITGGTGQISGNFTPQSAHGLAAAMMANR